MGWIADQMPGLIENGSIYTHGEAFYLYALAVAGQVDKCFDELTRVLPSNLVQEISTAPRQQQSNFTVGPDHQDFGQQYFSNFTGSVPWFRRVIEHLLGLYPDFDTLVVKPSVPAVWQDYEICKKWRNHKIRFVYQNNPDKQPALTMNGRTYQERIPLSELLPGRVNEIRFTEKNC